MMTVKHVDESGEESVYPARSVNFVPKGSRKDDADHHTLWRYTEDGTAVPLTGGFVYVMNVNGNTVARYDLELSRLPKAGQPKAA
ncbi:hypothetical protein [Rhizobium rhizogenes]|uniref:hypothetical protein n=1 Tax=Rhizobium rhizogenes TaxID=359 RepID=UPI0022717380|nr:hypothetical protein [Rhizobium rhizogenes]